MGVRLPTHTHVTLDHDKGEILVELEVVHGDAMLTAGGERIPVRDARTRFPVSVVRLIPADRVEVDPRTGAVRLRDA